MILKHWHEQTINDCIFIKKILTKWKWKVKVKSESDMTYSQYWWPILGIHDLHLTHPKCTHTAVNTHTHCEHTPGAVHTHSSENTHTMNTHPEQCPHIAVNTHTHTHTVNNTPGAVPTHSSEYTHTPWTTHPEQCTHTAVNTHTLWTHTWSSAHTHRTVNTHTAVNTHTPWTHTRSSGQPFMACSRAPHCGIVGGERAVHSLPPPTYNPRQTKTFRLGVWLSAIRPRLPPNKEC